MHLKNRFWHNQKGFVLPLALVVMAIGVMTVAPFLSGMSTTLISSRNSQVSTHEQYAVDGAYEDAVWDLKYGTLSGLLTVPCDSIDYTLQETVNGLQPSITVTMTSDCGGDDGLDTTTYQISVNAGSSSNLREYSVLPSLSLCGGMSPTIVGTDADDTLTGTNGDDVIAGLDGDDEIDGRGGEDVICGGAGDDTIDGGGKADTIYGGDGEDEVSGGSGDDVIYGEDDDDDLNGDAGKDSIDGGLGTDACDGGPGSDTIVNCE